jgi:hypothetical protein
LPPRETASSLLPRAPMEASAVTTACCVLPAPYVALRTRYRPVVAPPCATDGTTSVPPTAIFLTARPARPALGRCDGTCATAVPAPISTRSSVRTTLDSPDARFLAMSAYARASIRASARNTTLAARSSSMVGRRSSWTLVSAPPRRRARHATEPTVMACVLERRRVSRALRCAPTTPSQPLRPPSLP